MIVGYQIPRDWIAYDRMAIFEELMLIGEVHRRLVSGCDDDHCAPGRLRTRDQNVTFGAPRHRGAEGGEECEAALRGLVAAARGPFREHDPLIQALATLTKP
jgi:hypothetical protein